MADPKYENLPGIAYDQPDVYESGDLPEADQSDDNSEEENECIEKMNISISDSFKKFKGKQIQGSVDFSDRISRKIRTGYKCGEWELAAHGDVETPAERYQRLRCETTELMEQLIILQDKGPEDDKESLKQMAAQVASTKQILDELNFDESSNGGPQLDNFKKILDAINESKGAKETDTASSIVNLKPESVNLAQTTRLAQLEHRLHKLEAAVGAPPAGVQRVGATGGGLLHGAAELARRVGALQPALLDAAEQRLARLLPAMDALHAAAPPYDPQRDQKINELYDLVKKTEGISHTQLLERMQALEGLHKQASEFSKSMDELEALQSTITSGVQNNKIMLKGVQEVFANNLEHIQKEIKKLDDRISAVAKK